MRRFLPVLIGISALSIVALAFLHHSKNASAAAASHLVISEVQIGGSGAGTTGQDFIEIYNPTPFAVSLDGMRLGKYTSGTTSANVVVFADDDMVPAHGYFLWCNSSLAASLTCDASGSGTVANDNSVGLINGSLAAGTVVDGVSFGTPGSTFGEGTSLTAPVGGTSVERKANSTSTEASMGIGGLDEFMGNAEDTNDNSVDFVARAVPQPQNSTAASEPVEASPTPTPTITPEPTMTPSPTEEPSPTPTAEPSVTPTSTPIPSATPTVTPSPTNTPTPTMTPTPTATPTMTPTPTVTVAPTSTPTVSPTPTMIPSPTPTKGGKVIANGPLFTCTVNYRPWKVFNKTYFFPYINCVRTSN